MLCELAPSDGSGPGRLGAWSGQAPGSIHANTLDCRKTSCAFAGNRGLLHPELTAAATARQAQQVRDLDTAAHASCNRTCELGMTRATGQDYRHVLELLNDITSP